jgi:hypothetical protein
MDPKEQLEQLRKQIDDLNKRVASLGGEFFKDIDKAVASFGGGVKGAEAALKSLRKEMDGLNTDTNYFYESLKRVTAELKGQKSFNKDITSSYSKLSSIATKLKYDQDGISELSEKELKTLVKKIDIQRKELDTALGFNKDALKAANSRKESFIDEIKSLQAIKKQRGSLTQQESERIKEIGNSLKKENSLIKNIVEANEEVEDLLENQEYGLDKLQKTTAYRLKTEKDINKTLGITGQLVDGIVGSLGKLGISSDFFEDLKEDMREAAKSGDKWKVVSVGIEGVFKGIGNALKDPVAQLGIMLKLANFFFKSALNANAQSVELGKSLGYGAERADAFREKLVGIESASNNLNVNTANLVEAFGQLTEATGFAYEFTADQLNTQIKLTKQVGLTAEEAAQVQRFAILTGKTSEQTYRSFVKGLNATANQLKVGINFKATLAEAAKVSGQLAANLGNNPERIAKAVVTAKAFGMTLDQVAKSGESLLNFETSIDNELKAELLTGKQLNLERARAAALAGDQATLAEELAKNVGSSAEFTKMNVLQQRSLAEAVGMTADELANTLRKREEAIASGKTMAQLNDEERIEALERQNIQDKFNAAMLKLQSIIGNLLAGPLGSFVDSLASGLDTVAKIFGYFGKIGSFIKSIPGLGGLLGGIASVATIGTLIALVAKSMTKGTILNPMVTKDISAAGGGGGLGDLLGGKEGSVTKSRGGVFGRLKQAYKGGGIKGAGKSLSRMVKPGKLVKGAGKLLGKASVGGILGGMALDYGAEKAAESGNKNLAKGLGFGSGVLSGAGTGALVGSFFPGIGTAVGAGVGGLIGGLGALVSGDENEGTQEVEDGVALSNSGPFKIRDKFGKMAITKEGDNLAVSPNIKTSSPLGEGALGSAVDNITKILPLLNPTSLLSTLGGIKEQTPLDITPMIAALNGVKDAVDRLYNKDTTIKMDDRVVGSTTAQNSRKFA